MTIGIVDYGVGNVGSLLNMFRKLDLDAVLVSEPEEIDATSRLLLPGVGAFDFAMRELRTRGLVEPLSVFRASGRPLLGICLGMQLLLDGSDEGTSDGLGFVAGRAVRFSPSPNLRVPHMGWNAITPARQPPLPGLAEENRFYFVHSYYAACANESSVVARTNYGVDFASMIGDSNVLGAQFHPEKSHVFGMALLEGWSRS